MKIDKNKNPAEAGSQMSEKDRYQSLLDRTQIKIWS